MLPQIDDQPPTVTVIDDDDDIRQALIGLFRPLGLDVEAYASVREYLAGPRSDAPGCMVLDVRLPGKSGLDFLEEMVRGGIRIPVIFISGYADVPMSVRAMKAGAVEFLTKPVRPQDLLDAVQSAIEHDRLRREDNRSRNGVFAALAMLSKREREVMSLVVKGRRNKQIAADLGLSEATVKLHRGRVMDKLRVQSVPELVRIADMVNSQK